MRERERELIGGGLGRTKWDKIKGNLDNGWYTTHTVYESSAAVAHSVKSLNFPLGFFCLRLAVALCMCSAPRAT